jgi:aspartate aminotransferase
MKKTKCHPEKESGTLKIFHLMKTLQARGRDIINLCVGEPDIPPSEHIKKSACLAIEENRIRYTASEGIPELREMVATRLKEEGWDVDPSREILITAGAKPALFITFIALAETGDKCLIPLPYYPSYPSMIHYSQAESRIIPGNALTGYKVSPDDIIPHLSQRSRFFILNSPVNPTGSVYTPSELRHLLDFLKKHDIICINDDVYRHFIYDHVLKNEIADVLKDYRKNMILIRSFSKEFSMTGWRIGYVTASENVISKLKIFQGHTSGNPQTASQYAALQALKSGPEARIPLHIFKKRRDMCSNKLKTIKNLTWVKPEGAFYLYVDIRDCAGKMDSDDLCRHLMENFGVAVTPGTAFGQEGFIRISYADGSRLEEGLERLSKGLFSG